MMPIHEYGIISLENLPSLDSFTDYATNKTAQMISEALSDFKLWSKGAMFICILNDSGKHDLSELR
jgi:hypothetical protein